MRMHKVLWCDRNVHRFDLRVMLSGFKNIELSIYEDVGDALEELKNNYYSLVISGNKFADGSDGISFFKGLNALGLRPQFLLLTGDILPKDDPCLLLQNFTYVQKVDINPEFFNSIIEELLSKSIPANDLHLRLRAIRLYFKLSEREFASFLGTTSEKVMAYEEGREIPSNYIMGVCKNFNIPLSYLSSFSYDLFLKRMDELTYDLKQKVRP